MLDYVVNGGYFEVFRRLLGDIRFEPLLINTESLLLHRAVGWKGHVDIVRLLLQDSRFVAISVRNKVRYNNMLFCPS